MLRWGNRYQLVVLEKNGRHFHWLIDRYFKEAPFLRLNLKLLPRYLYFTFPILNSEMIFGYTSQENFVERPLNECYVRNFLPLFAALCLRIFTPELLHRKLHFLLKRQEFHDTFRKLLKRVFMGAFIFAEKSCDKKPLKSLSA